MNFDRNRVFRKNDDLKDCPKIMVSLIIYRSKLGEALFRE